MRSTQFSSAPNWEQILYSYVRETDFFPPILLVKMRLAHLLNVCCLHPAWPICTQSAILERRIRWAFMWAGPVLEAPLVWNLSDLFNALMVFPNLLALLALSGLVAKAARGGDALRK